VGFGRRRFRRSRPAKEGSVQHEKIAAHYVHHLNQSRLPLTIPALPSSTLTKGSWDSIHVFEVRERSSQAHYSLTSTILLYLGNQVLLNESSEGDVGLSGTMTRQIEVDAGTGGVGAHVVNVGKMIEDVE
jgi:hypothetical protein